jgi:diguanylate cyclase (GGDEF)-like protein
MLGLPPAPGEQAPAAAADWLGRVHPEDLRQVETALQAHMDGKTPHLEAEFRCVGRAGDARWLLARGKLQRDADGKPSRLAGSMADVTSMRKAEDDLRKSAIYDRLTGLPNRTLFIDRLAQRLVPRAGRRARPFALALLDLDHFKNVNEGAGPAAGDEMLRAVGQRISAHADARRATAARLGGDEFAVLADLPPGDPDGDAFAAEFLDALSRPFAVAGREVAASASAGLVVGPGDYTEADQLLRDADTAMYLAKSRGRARWERFVSGLRAEARDRLDMASGLKRALDAGGLRLEYQPILSLADGSLCGFEALMRWDREDGPVSPGTFIPFAEDNGLIVRMGAWALREACSQLARWRARPGCERLSMSVNVSGRQIEEDGFVGVVEGALRESGLEPSALKLEVTESVLMRDPERTMRALGEVRRLGPRLAIDDFGTGFSSLAYLTRFRMDTLKIDRSFVIQMRHSEDSRKVVAAIATLASNLNLDVVAEGIEREEDAGSLKRMGCQFGQGWLFSKSLPTDQAASLAEAAGARVRRGTRA